MTKTVELIRGSREEVTCPAGSPICELGQWIDVMYVVREGEVEIRSGDRDDDVLEILGPGGIFGELAVVNGWTWTAHVVARTDCVLVPLDRPRFEALVQRAPSFAVNVMTVMADRHARPSSRM